MSERALGNILGDGVELHHEPLPADEVVEGRPTTATAPLGELGGAEFGLWEMSVGSARDTEVDEVFVVLAGAGRITFDDGSVLELSRGVAASLRAGQRTVWTITERLRKLYITPSTDTVPVDLPAESSASAVATPPDRVPPATAPGASDVAPPGDQATQAAGLGNAAEELLAAATAYVARTPVDDAPTAPETTTPEAPAPERSGTPEPAATEPPATEAQATEAQATEAPATEAQATEAPLDAEAASGPAAGGPPEPHEPSEPVVPSPAAPEPLVPSPNPPPATAGLPVSGGKRAARPGGEAPSSAFSDSLADTAAAERPRGRFAGKVAVVTGGARGIGFATASRFAAEGASVAVLDLDATAARAAAEDLPLGPGQSALGIGCDVADTAGAEAAVARVVTELGGLHLLVNNAGITRDNLLFKMSDADWDQVIGVHLRGAFVMTRAAQKQFVEQRFGRVVCLSSTSALGNRGQANYSAAKMGLQGFVRTLAIELGPFGVTANAVAPGFIATEMTDATAARLGMDVDSFRAVVADANPVKRIGQPDDIAAAITFLCSDEASFITGQTLYVDGGATLS